MKKYIPGKLRFQKKWEKVGGWGWNIISLKNIQFKVISYVNSNKKLHNSLKIALEQGNPIHYRFTKFPKKYQPEVSQKWQYLPVQALLFYILWCKFLSLPLWTYADNACVKCWTKFRNFMFFESEILLMKSKMSHFAPDYPTLKIQYAYVLVINKINRNH